MKEVYNILSLFWYQYGKGAIAVLKRDIKKNLWMQTGKQCVVKNGQPENIKPIVYKKEEYKLAH